MITTATYYTSRQLNMWYEWVWSEYSHISDFPEHRTCKLHKCKISDWLKDYLWGVTANFLPIHM